MDNIFLNQISFNTKKLKIVLKSYKIIFYLNLIIIIISFLINLKLNCSLKNLKTFLKLFNSLFFIK